MVGVKKEEEQNAIKVITITITTETRKEEVISMKFEMVTKMPNSYNRK